MMKKCESQEEGERQYLTIYIGEGSKSLKEIIQLWEECHDWFKIAFSTTSSGLTETYTQVMRRVVA